MMLLALEYRKAASVPDAVKLYDDFGGEAQYLGGGTDLIPRVKLRLEKPQALIDLKSIEELATVGEDEGHIRIGSLVSLFDLKRHELVADHFPALKASLELTSCETLQMRGTIGGNLLQNSRCLFYNQSEFWRTSKGFCLKMGGACCNAVQGAKACFANYCSDNAPALCTLSAELRLVGPNGERRIALIDLYTKKSDQPFDLQAGEILTDILVPKRKSLGAYDKLRLRGAIDYPLLGVAFSLFNGEAKLAVGSVGPAPKVFRMGAVSQDEIEHAVRLAADSVKPVANTVLDPDYRKRMISVMARRLVKQTIEEAK